MHALIEEAVANGARRAPACAVLGVSVRTLERWRAGASEDGRQGPRTRPANALSAPERATLLATVNSATYCDLSPHQIVPRLADAGQYLASESTMYRVLREEQQLAHRGRSGGAAAAGDAVARSDRAQPGMELGHHVPQEPRARRVLVPVLDPRHLEPEDRRLDRRGDRKQCARRDPLPRHVCRQHP